MNIIMYHKIKTKTIVGADNGGVLFYLGENCMTEKRILFISGSVGLGHIGRDVAIAKALRIMDPEVRISWLAKDPASLVLEQEGEQLLEEAKLLANENTALEKNADNYEINVIKTLMGMRKAWPADVEVISHLVKREHFDLVVGDETYDLLTERTGNKDFSHFPFIIIFDMIGLDSTGWSPLEKIVVYMVNRGWLHGLEANPPIADRTLFIGEPDDIPDRQFGFLLPKRRDLANKHVDFVGNVLTFNPKYYLDKETVKKQLGYGTEPLIVCSIGGTSVGKDLLSLCSEAYPLIKAKIPNLKMVLACGPHVSPDSIQPVEGLEIKGYIPELFKHFAAADLCIVTGGGTTVLELIALQKPFLYFPLGKHFEQQKDVVWKCERLKVGIRMDYKKTTNEGLADTVLSNIDKKVNYASIPMDGAERGAKLIMEILKKPKV